jgi:lipopolysaccharide transport system permease protein
MEHLPKEQITVFTSRPDTVSEYLRKLYRYRSLIWVFAMRDLRVKYSQTLIGIGWSLLQPLTALVIFTYLFGFVLNWTAGELPYALYVLSGLLGWNFFSYNVHAGTASVQESSALIRKIYFPKSILPLSKTLVALIELGLSFLILVPLMVYFGYGLSWRILLLPLVIVFNGVCGLSLVFWVAAIAYKKRDLFHLLPFVVYFGIWLSPVFFVADMLPIHAYKLLIMNPMTSVVDFWRWMLFGEKTFSGVWLVSFTLVTFVCISGMFYFHRKEGEFSDHA